MGLASFILGENNPFAQWTNQNQNFLGAIGSGLGQGQNIQDGLAAGLAQMPQAKQADAAAAEKAKADKLAESQANATQNWLQANHPDLAQMVQAGMPVGEAWQTAMQRMQPGTEAKPLEVNGQLIDPNTYQVLGDYRTTEGKGGNAEVALQPTWMQDSQGNWVLGQLAKDGKLVQTELPPGMRAANPGAISGDRTSGTVDAKTSGNARAALPSAEQNFEIANRAADSLLNDQKGMSEQFGNILGVPQQMTPAWPGSPKANFQVQLDQLTGQAFLNIRQALKGAGAVTDYEGQRGEVALSRAQAAAEKGDQKAFEAAVIEFKDAISKGLELLRQQAQGGYSAGSPAVGGAPPSGGNQTSTGVTWSVEP